MISKKRLLILEKIQEKPISFNDLKRSLGFESNDLAYHLQKMQQQGLLFLDMKQYALTDVAKNNFPYFTLEEKPIFTVAAVAVLYNGKYYGQIKKREPGKGLKIFFGSKVPAEKSITQAAYDFVLAQAKIIPKNLTVRFINEYKSEGHWMVYFFTAESDTKPEGVVMSEEDLDLFGDTKLLLKHVRTRITKVNLL